MFAALYAVSANGSDEVKISQENLAQLSRITRRSVNTSLSILRHLKLIFARKDDSMPGRDRPLIYTINLDKAEAAISSGKAHAVTVAKRAV